MNKRIKSVLITEKEIEEMVLDLANQINHDYEGKDILAVIILKGSMFFASDLIRHLTCNVKIDFMQVSSYGEKTYSDGNLIFKKDLETNIEGKHVLIIEDIIDSGRTLKKLIAELESRNAESVKICTLLSKPSRRKINIDVTYVGREIPDEFIVGYGMDFSEQYRHLPYIAILNPYVYEHEDDSAQ